MQRSSLPQDSPGVRCDPELASFFLPISISKMCYGKAHLEGIALSVLTLGSVWHSTFFFGHNFLLTKLFSIFPSKIKSLEIILVRQATRWSTVRSVAISLWYIYAYDRCGAWPSEEDRFKLRQREGSKRGVQCDVLRICDIKWKMKVMHDRTIMDLIIFSLNFAILLYYQVQSYFTELIGSTARNGSRAKKTLQKYSNTSLMSSTSSPRRGLPNWQYNREEAPCLLLSLMNSKWH